MGSGMNAVLIFDTETTGLVDKKAPPEAPHQPDIVQIAAMLCERDDSQPFGFRERRSATFLIRPQGWKVSPGAERVHGLSAQVLDTYGVSRRTALDTVKDMVEKASVLVAHNIAFDAFVLRTAWIREYGEDMRALVSGKQVFCTMKASIPVCRILHKNARHAKDYKWPKLSECVETLFGEKLEGAHDAGFDTRACARVYFALKRRYRYAEEAKAPTEPETP